MNVKRYIINNKRRSIYTILGITLASSLILSIGIFFSSFREYLIENVKKEIGDYHVIVKGDIEEDSTVKKIKIKDDRSFITFNNIYRVYKNTERICKKSKCESITYNDSLLSLYGISKNENMLSTLKKIIYFLVISLSIVLFFIIYNSFKVSLNNRKRDICLLKLSGFTNMDVYKLITKESLVLGLLGIFLGFIIALILNSSLIGILNNFLYELFNGNLKLKVYIPFIMVPLIFMIIIIALSSLLSLKNIKKYRAMEIFKDKDEVQNVEVTPLNNIPLWLSILNYQRQREKYKSLIICIFISVLSINVFSLILRYGLKCINDYVITPDYDLSVSIEEDYDLDKIAEDLKAQKKLIFKSCTATSSIPKENYIKEAKEKENILITNIGGNEIVNKIDKIETDNKINHVKYKRFKELDEITLDHEKTIDNLKLIDKIPFGLNGLDDVIINLDEEKFDEVCENYNSNMFIKTKYQGIDKYLNDIIKKEELKMSYVNTKKSKEITNNLITVIKLVLYSICFLIILVMLSSVINITSASIDYRKKEFSSLKSIGLENNKIIFSLFIESLIISLKGYLYAVPFIFIINKYIYKSIKEVFVYKTMIVGIESLFISFLISLILVFISMIISHRDLKTKSLISNIR